MSEFLRVERKGAIATVWIDRQAKMNTMTVAMRNEFPAMFMGLDGDDAVRVVVIRGAGGKAFSAGGDVAEFLTLAPADLELWGDTLTWAERCRKPVIAAIDGYAMGAGLELALACDFRIATRRSEFSFPEVRLGMIPGSGGTQRTLRLVGETRAEPLMLTGRRLPGAEAGAWGLLNHAGPHGRVGGGAAPHPAQPGPPTPPAQAALGVRPAPLGLRGGDGRSQPGRRVSRYVRPPPPGALRPAVGEPRRAVERARLARGLHRRAERGERRAGGRARRDGRPLERTRGAARRGDRHPPPALPPGEPVAPPRVLPLQPRHP